MKVNSSRSPAPKKRRTQAERTAATRALLIEAGRKLFADKGFAEVSTHAIAEGAIPQQPVRSTAHILLGALDEAALFISRASNREEAREQMTAVADRLL